MVCTLVKPNAAQAATLSEGVNGISRDDLKQPEETVKVSEFHRRGRKG